MASTCTLFFPPASTGLLGLRSTCTRDAYVTRRSCLLLEHREEEVHYIYGTYKKARNEFDKMHVTSIEWQIRHRHKIAAVQARNCRRQLFCLEKQNRSADSGVCVERLNCTIGLGLGGLSPYRVVTWSR